jgi:predicted NBD/HSP70 family sugar kinase
VFAAAEAGDPRALHLVHRAADYLAQTVVAIATLLDPDVVLLGGSIARNEPVVGRRIREVVAMTLPYPPAVRPAALEDRAPLVGALALIGDHIGGVRIPPAVPSAGGTG